MHQLQKKHLSSKKTCFVRGPGRANSLQIDCTTFLMCFETLLLCRRVEKVHCWYRLFLTITNGKNRKTCERSMDHGRHESYQGSQIETMSQLHTIAYNCIQLLHMASIYLGDLWDHWIKSAISDDLLRYRLSSARTATHRAAYSWWWALWLHFPLPTDDFCVSKSLVAGWVLVDDKVTVAKPLIHRGENCNDLGTEFTLI